MTWLTDNEIHLWGYHKNFMGNWDSSIFTGNSLSYLEVCLEINHRKEQVLTGSAQFQMENY